MKYEIEKGALWQPNNENWQSMWQVFINDEHEADCPTLSQAYVYLAKHMQQCALLEMEREGKPCLTT